jgi:hypothetical protein
MALAVERTPAIADLLYTRGLPGPNRWLRDGASVGRGMQKRDRLTRTFSLGDVESEAP